ncbi:beta-galactosidase-like [Brevipalpus obovatus]|uniref:beta-galactosidase-like n=1 Tax=Brevipalpus obovatus TaxID=246614 RepID=UPI003D9E9FD9
MIHMNHFFLISILTLIIFTQKTNSRNFSIDWQNDQFLLDDEPFHYVSGSLHYFRVPHEYWNDRLSTMRMAGINAVQTYVEWSSHESKENVFNFEGDLNLTNFLDLAVKNDLVVLLRVGPYICAERDFGGLPFWLLKYTSSVRQNNKEYQKYVQRWFTKLLPMIKPYLYSNGGPVIMVQVENEYGSYFTCDFEHTTWLRNLIRRLLGESVVLYSTDGWTHSSLKCGLIDEVFGTIDFGVDIDVKKAFDTLRAHRAHGPLVNSEFYPGWLDHWALPHEKRKTDDIVSHLEKMFEMNASVNFYMFFGGTSFGLTSGANTQNESYLPQLTSYDYDAPMDEAGDPTDKYFKIRQAIGRYLPLPPGDPPKPKPKQSIGPLTLEVFMNFTQIVKQPALKHERNNSVQTFETLGVKNGFVLYSTKLNFKPTIPSVLEVTGIRDRGYVFVDFEFQGIVSRMEEAYQLPIRARKNSVLTIFVENQGRINFGDKLVDYKGIISDVKLENRILKDWDHAFVENWEDIFTQDGEFRRSVQSKPFIQSNQQSAASIVPAFLRTEFKLEQNAPLYDTYLNTLNLTKGIAYLNGHCLGRYWPSIGPQITLYTPGVWLKPYPEDNELIVLEQEPTDCVLRNECGIRFDAKPIIDGPTPTGNSNTTFKIVIPKPMIKNSTL